ncbi:MAG: SPOR domain-containing protein [Balneolaceae bacterium]|nr:SPOR domain-containing protein [Balneolaceae bacterium]MBO6545696.1 SPOR domain-containing protein [Balneolaceae bacterium]MBO6647092.1 SPOR domain-containing protein [Balneolaceae bacterium]
MHIDHQKLVELLTDASGIEAEKIEKQIGELVEEIQQALEDGEAYEIDGFGIFSGIGNRVLFIPSKELETEINFKYVGMEPIELEEDQVQKEEKREVDDPFEELQGDVSDNKRDPFAGLVEDFDEEETEEAPMIFGVEAKESLAEEEEEEEEFQPGPEEWGIDAHKEGDKGANRLISSLMGEEYEEETEEEPESETSEEQTTDEEVVEDEVSFDDIFGETDESSEEELKEDVQKEESVSGLDAELAGLMAEDSEIRSEDELAAGIVDDDFADIFGEAEEEPEDDGVTDDEPEDEEVIDELVEEIETSEEEPAEEEPLEQEEKEEPEELKLEETEDDFDDFDDPFLELESDEEPGENDSELQEEDIVPVITNISSDLEPIAKEEPKKEKEQQQKNKKDKPKRTKTDPQPAPVWLWIVLALVVLVGSTVGLAYFSIINIPGITPQIATSNIPAVTTPPVQQTPSPTQQPEETSAQVPNEGDAQEEQPPAQEQQAPAEVPVPTGTTEAPDGQSKYGMMGTASNQANDGYTVVLYSLSIQSNAYAKQQELSNAGFRALVTPIPSEQYGTLWRVSIGQFASLTDAAIAAEDMPAEYKQSYFIKRITN